MSRRVDGDGNRNRCLFILFAGDEIGTMPPIVKLVLENPSKCLRTCCDTLCGLIPTQFGRRVKVCLPLWWQHVQVIFSKCFASIELSTTLDHVTLGEIS